MPLSHISRRVTFIVSRMLPPFSSLKSDYNEKVKTYDQQNWESPPPQRIHSNQIILFIV